MKKQKEKSGQTIEIKCTYDRLYQYSELTPTQGKLKSITKEATNRLIKSIKNNGYVFPIYVWQHEGKNWIIGGHHRSAVIHNLQKSGYVIEGIPATHVKAASMDEAKKFVLLDSAQYAAIDKKLFGDFIADTSMNLDEILAEVSNKEIDLSDATKQLMDVRYDQVKNAEGSTQRMIVAFAVTKDEFKAINAAAMPKRIGDYARDVILEKLKV